jgi:hypothetical protein
MRPGVNDGRGAEHEPLETHAIPKQPDLTCTVFKLISEKGTAHMQGHRGIAKGKNKGETFWKGNHPLQNTPSYTLNFLATPTWISGITGTQYAIDLSSDYIHGPKWKSEICWFQSRLVLESIMLSSPGARESICVLPRLLSRRLPPR